MPLETTSEKIIEAAIDEFAAAGYDKATIRNIANRAQVNLAAINYHFSSKKELYRQVFETLFNDFHPLPSGENIRSQQDLEAALHEWITAFMTRVLGLEPDNDPRRYRIAVNEILNPSEAHDELLDNHLRRDVDPLVKIIRAGMPLKSSRNELTIKVFAVLGKCFFYTFHRHIVTKFSGSDDFVKKNFSQIVEVIFEESVNNLAYHD